MSSTPTHRRDGQPAPRVRFKALPALAALLGLVAGTAGTAVPQQRPFRLALARSVVQSQNETDMLAAMKVWAETLVRESGLAVEPHVSVLAGMENMVAAIRDGRIDGVTLSLSEYAAFPEGLLGGPFIRPLVASSVEVEFVLVAARNGPVKGIRDLANARVTVHDIENSDVGLTWLDAQLAVLGMGRLRAIATSVELTPKASAAVLNVFFGKADACLVRRSVFASAVELNPQVGARMAEVAVSESIAPSFLSFRAGVADTIKGRLSQEILRLHESTVGQQVVRMFKADRMGPLTAEEVERSVRMFNGWVQAAEGAAPPTSAREGERIP